MAFKLDSSANVCGTSLKGKLNTSYSALRALFGDADDCDGYKVSGEWVFTDSEGNAVTLYDWKSTELYDELCPSVESFRQLSSATFNVGAKDRSVANNFIKWIENEIRSVS